MKTKVELAPDYYRENFITLLTEVISLYEDLLHDPEIQFAKNFQALSLPPQCLFVRLISRKGPLFRSDKLEYQEIPSIGDAANELYSAGFISRDGDFPLQDLLALLRKPELISLTEELELLIQRNEKKAALIDQIGELGEESEIADFIKTKFHVYAPLRLEALSLYMLLFFGNFYQDLSEFVIADLGIVNYEQYPLDRSIRPFSRRELIDTVIELHSVSEELSEGLSELSADQLMTLIATVPDPIDHPVILRRHGRLCTTVARQLERLNDPESAIRVYEMTDFQPSRERQARIHYKIGNAKKATEIVETINRMSGNEEELDFASAFADKIEGKRRPSADKTDVSDTQVICIAEPIGPSVEEFVLNMYAQAGVAGFYTENTLWCGLFGIAFWDIIFSPIVGAFFNPYQRGPADLYEPDFRSRREQLIQAKLCHILDVSEIRWRRELRRTYREKCGTANAFVNWKYFTEELFSVAIKSIPPAHFVAVFDRICSNIRTNTAGFPDLVLFPRIKAKRISGGAQRYDVITEEDRHLPYLLVEVKGPGDQLQKNQKRWMRHFRGVGVPHRVVRLKKVDSSMTSIQTLR
ncbi:MAG: hypothetical protein CMN78_03530 [Spirochaetales bacterium]|nr:hypothetical protein [Spirochaetales bacterium]